MNHFLTILLSVVILSFAGNVSAQCNDELIDTGMESLEDFTYLKDFKVRLKRSTKRSPQIAKYSIMMTKGTKYRFTTSNDMSGDGCAAVFTLYDENGIVITNQPQGMEKVFTTVDLTCKKSGRYYVTIHFKDGTEGCAVVLLGFENKANKIEDLLDY